jgi:hypothetical protein
MVITRRPAETSHGETKLNTPPFVTTLPLRFFLAPPSDQVHDRFTSLASVHHPRLLILHPSGSVVYERSDGLDCANGCVSESAIGDDQLRGYAYACPYACRIDAIAYVSRIACCTTGSDYLNPDRLAFGGLHSCTDSRTVRHASSPSTYRPKSIRDGWMEHRVVSWDPGLFLPWLPQSPLGRVGVHRRCNS